MRIQTETTPNLIRVYAPPSELGFDWSHFSWRRPSDQPVGEVPVGWVERSNRARRGYMIGGNRLPHRVRGWKKASEAMLHAAAKHVGWTKIDPERAAQIERIRLEMKEAQQAIDDVYAEKKRRGYANAGDRAVVEHRGRELEQLGMRLRQLQEQGE